MTVVPRSITTSDSLSLAVWEHGDRANPTVVLVHGYPDTHRVWDGVVGHLAGDHHVVVYDVRGAGASDAPAHRAGYDLTHLVADLVAVVDATAPEGPVHLVGHDWGSVQSWEAVCSGALGDRLASFTSMSGPALDHVGRWLRDRREGAGGRADLIRQGLKSWYVGFFNLPRVPERAAARGDFDRHLLAGGMTQDEVAAVRRDVVDAGALPGGLGWYRAIPVALPIAPRLWSLRVQVPVTHVWSDGDVALGPRTAELASRWTDGEFESRTLAGASHWLPEQHPDEIAEIVLDRVSRA